MHIKIMVDNESLTSETSTFCKWIRQSYPDVKISIPESKVRHQLNDHSLLLPLVQLVTELDLVNYLNLTLEYMNFKCRGSMKSDKQNMELRAEVPYGNNGELKLFHFKGTADDFSKTVKKFDPNAFFRGD
ncbi:hypothetical protein GLP21_05050 [Photobacterium carnosum]|uniref:hypothetical protein n=1 Tax=Photobacterium carnosum TaxID=2023717 RepID=UPI001E4D493F|nr:hypothetical protein [Photobacterium carnosum]MCD9548025.1 hypothetical protein [Photobacterium carnosum]MCD9553611.1 hypothetical protein [Photobacterium carnosum]MCF2305274.1 hypothetical protein [Photobacterium carnosum]